jgi:hypothetical protein
MLSVFATTGKTWMPNRRQLLLASAASMALAAELPRVSEVFAGGAAGRLSLGLSGLAYWIGFCPFLDWQKMAGPYEVTRSMGGKLSGKAAFDGGYLDSASGEIANPVPSDAIAFTRVFYASPGIGNTAGGYDFSREDWIIKWDGTGHCVIGGGCVASQVIDNRSGSGKFRFRSSGNAWVTFTITNIHDPPRNVRIYQARYASNLAAGEKFNPDWLARIRSFGILRFMDWMATNNSMITDFSQIAGEDYFAWGQTVTSSSKFGPKGGVPLSLICEVANLTRCNVHFCIPHLATDACVRSIAEYFRDHLSADIVITFEYSNECWNFVFVQARYCADQAKTMWPGSDGARWYGFRSAQCMKLIRDVFNNRARWRGCLATQTINADVTRHALVGVDYFRANGLSPEKSLSVADLFDEVSVTGYFGDIQGSRRLTRITNANPAVVTSPSHGYTNGQRLKLFIATGMTELNDTFVTVGNATKDTFELLAVDSHAFKTFVTDNRSYATPALLFELMDASNAKFIADSKNYPTKYTYFNRVVAASWLNGSSEGFVTGHSIASLRDEIWPAQRAVADAAGLDLRQYEGGLHFVGDINLASYGGNPQFTEYLVHIGHTKETAEVYTAMYLAFFQIGGHYPSKFVEGGPTGPYGTWGGMRFIPGDEHNSVWAAVQKANSE